MVTIKRRDEVLWLLQHLPQIAAVSNLEALLFVERRTLIGKGLGWIDVHLLASTVASRQMFWTRDKRLAAAAERLGIAA